MAFLWHRTKMYWVSMSQFRTQLTKICSFSRNCCTRKCHCVRLQLKKSSQLLPSRLAKWDKMQATSNSFIKLHSLSMNNQMVHIDLQKKHTHPCVLCYLYSCFTIDCSKYSRVMTNSPYHYHCDWSSKSTLQNARNSATIIF